MSLPNPSILLDKPSAQAGSEQRFLRRVGLWMVLGLALTTLVAGCLMNSPHALEMFFRIGKDGKTGLSALGWGAMLAPLGLVLVVGAGARRASAPVVTGAYLLIAACFGVTLAPIGLTYAPGVLAETLAATCGAFAGFAAWGFFSKRDLGGFGSFAFMGLIGLIVLGVVQIFWNNGALNFLLGCGGVIVFTLLTAWDMQKIRQSAPSGDQRLAVLGALSLYLDFINLFISLLRLFGGNGSRN